MRQIPINQSISVFIVGNNRLFNESVSASLINHKEIAVVGSADDPDEALEMARSMLVDVVLINATMERTSIVQVIRSIKEELPRARVIVLGLDYKEEDNLEFIEAGASGYVLKGESVTDLIHKIELIHNGQTNCSPRMAALVFARITELSREYDQEMPHQDELTRREKEILQLIIKGLSNKEIANHLHVTLYTVKNHVHSVLQKLQVHRRQDVIVYLQDYKDSNLKGL